MKYVAARPPSSRWLYAAGILSSILGLYYYRRYRRRNGSKTHLAADAIDLLKEDHERIRNGLEHYAKTTDPAGKDKLVEQLLLEFQIHSSLEEEIFYPAIRALTGDQELMDAAEHQHAQAQALTKTIADRRETGELYYAVVEELAVALREHIADEETIIFPRIATSPADRAALGFQMARRRRQLQTKLGVTPGVTAS